MPNGPVLVPEGNKMSYRIIKNAAEQTDASKDLAEAIALAQAGMARIGYGENATFAVVDEHEEVFAAVTNRRIMGLFTKQVWTGAEEDGRSFCGEQHFDATDLVLSLPLESIHALEDGESSTASIGRQAVNWTGPCEVEIVDEILNFFGTCDLESITWDALVFARTKHPPTPMKEVTFTLTVKVKARMPEDASVEDFARKLDYDPQSAVAGAIVLSTEIVGFK